MSVGPAGVWANRAPGGGDKPKRMKLTQLYHSVCPQVLEKLLFTKTPDDDANDAVLPEAFENN